MPKDAATIDHICSRLDPQRRYPPLNEKRHVLSCSACNHQRGHQDIKKHIEIQHQHGQHQHLHELPYLERKWRLQELQKRVDKGIQGLISVMGLPEQAKITYNPQTKKL
jgi:hypothetical protein